MVLRWSTTILQMTLLFVRVDQGSIDGPLSCLDDFYGAFGAIVNPHKFKFWLTGMDSPLACISATWSYILVFHLG